LIARGRTLFTEKGCYGCHTVDSAGTPIAPDLRRAAARYPEATLAGWLRDASAQEPTRHMPNLELSEAQAGALAAYLGSLRWSAQSRGSRRMKIRTILVPLDGSTLAEAALPKSWSWRRRPAPPCSCSGRPTPRVDPTEAQVKVVGDAETYLAQVQERLARKGRVTVGTSVWYGPAAHAIVEAARIHKVEEIVMTKHGRSGLGRLLLGRVAESVLRGSPTPILVVHAEGTANQVPIGQAKPWEAR
jgi:nucleotide-binding universal stress UspA family protein/cytochrome c551/c552